MHSPPRWVFCPLCCQVRRRSNARFRIPASRKGRGIRSSPHLAKQLASARYDTCATSSIEKQFAKKIEMHASFRYQLAVLAPQGKKALGVTATSALESGSALQDYEQRGLAVRLV